MKLTIEIDSIEVVNNQNKVVLILGGIKLPIMMMLTDFEARVKTSDVEYNDFIKGMIEAGVSETDAVAFDKARAKPAPAPAPAQQVFATPTRKQTEEEADEIDEIISGLGLKVQEQVTLPFRVGDDATGESGTSISSERVRGLSRIVVASKEAGVKREIYLAGYAALDALMAVPLKTLMRYSTVIDDRVRRLMVDKMMQQTGTKNGFDYIPANFAAFIEGNTEFADEMARSFGNSDTTSTPRMIVNDDAAERSVSAAWSSEQPDYSVPLGEVPEDLLASMVSAGQRKR
jgi:hypothetical protein